MSVQDENEYEDLLGLWSDLESGLGILLGSPLSVQEFEQRVWQYDRWMQALLQRDADVGIYLLFQLATNSSVGYSASHSLVCATLCHLLAAELKLEPKERDSLVHAALTMNIAMTELQDELALQTEKLSPPQLEVVRLHAPKGGLMLAKNLGVSDPLWIEVVSSHHDEYTEKIELRLLPPHKRLVRILRVVDRYAAMISPRKSREGRSTTESVRTIMTGANAYNDEIGHALVRAVGLCPPGTYVRLEDNTLAIVMRRSPRPNLPHVAVVTGADGQVLPRPRLHRTLSGRPVIQAALAASVVRLRLNHHLILQLGAHAAQMS
ncbi:MAG: phosphodiesterase [Hylemonella sp.]|uniref:HD-GYP domain-containing protein n=1 Tax=Hylemonella sp. TaxID=2066020 RepID=UPI0022C5A3A7|nr:phosphodiesterase [Hylemonella sp.]MCZ8251139.1 phosphodiesterase [Hylemonella sp.]